MATGVQDFNRTEFDRLNEIKGHLEIALLEKHFLRESQSRSSGVGLPEGGPEPGTVLGRLLDMGQAEW